ncbi:MAG: D-Ala-D-Ala carboxypeptidase family metallohydrolase [Magnetococcus sp. YQC-5]
MKLTDHFTLEELTASDTAHRMGLDNMPSDEALSNLRLTAEKMEIVRLILKSNPISVSSGFRCEELNARIGGSKNSAHVQGLAVDFTCAAFGTPLEICRALARFSDTIQFDQLIMEGRWAHIGFTKKAEDARHETLTANFSTGKAVYSKGIIG